jgi:hypothetical protein
MVAEESEMKISANGATIEAENPLPARSDAQIALAFDSEGNHQTVTEAADSHDGRKPRRKQPRYDTRRTAEYLSERGRLPAEALHLITRRTLPEAIAYIRKAVPGSSHDWAANYYMRAIELLLPYCHLKQSDLDNAGGLDGVHSLLAGHFLAASQFGARTVLDAPRGSGGAMLGRSRLIDSGNGAAQAGDREAHTMPHTNTAVGSVVTLPPRGRD